jgi:hypothetical protein
MKDSIYDSLKPTHRLTKTEGQVGLKRKVLLYGIVAMVFIACHGPSAWLAYFLQFPGQGSGGLDSVLLNVAIFAAWGGIHSVLSRHDA